MSQEGKVLPIERTYYYEENRQNVTSATLYSKNTCYVPQVPKDFSLALLMTLIHRVSLAPWLLPWVSRPAIYYLCSASWPGVERGGGRGSWSISHRRPMEVPRPEELRRKQLLPELRPPHVSFEGKFKGLHSTASYDKYFSPSAKVLEDLPDFMPFQIARTLLRCELRIWMVLRQDSQWVPTIPREVAMIDLLSTGETSPTWCFWVRHMSRY